MRKGRLEAFSDGVIAIIITIMVLELKVPKGATADTLVPLLPVLLSYLLSFINIAIYWNNHHHLLHTVTRVTGPILWANMHLLFWLSLLPFASGWMGQNQYDTLPVALYGAVLLMSGVGFYILQSVIVASEGRESLLAKAIGRDWKGRASVALYLAALCIVFWMPVVSLAIYVLVAMMWLIPDRRIEQAVAARPD